MRQASRAPLLTRAAVRGRTAPCEPPAAARVAEVLSGPRPPEGPASGVRRVRYLGLGEQLYATHPRLPGETHHVNERVRCTVFEVRKAGSRVKVILSRARPQLVQRLFEQEIPEIADGVIQTIRGVTNPDKLAHLGPVADVRAILRQGRTER